MLHARISQENFIWEFLIEEFHVEKIFVTQELAYQEQYEIFGDDTREATLNDIQQMTYLERVIKECLRLYPSVPWMSRTLNDDLTLSELSPWKHN